jgi:hypothetical protein
VGVAHGWIIDYLVPRMSRSFASTGSSLRGWVLEGGGVGWVVSGTLLGPEGSDASSVAFSSGLTCCLYRVSLLWGWRRVRVVGFRPYVENYTVDASIFVSQVFKGARWMPWHQEPKKDVGICDKPRGVDNQTVIRGFPNGETRLEESPVTLT